MPSFFQQGWHTVSDVWYDPSLEHRMQEILRIRSETFALATRCKDKDRLIKGPAETDVALYVPQAQALCDLLHATMASCLTYFMWLICICTRIWELGAPQRQKMDGTAK